MAWTVRAGSPEAADALERTPALAADLAHAARRRDPARRAATLERRRLLRALAARTLGAAPAAVEVEQAPDGPPRIVAPRPLHAAAAARDGWTLLALAPTPVGVDVERIEPGAHRPLDLLHPDLSRRLHPLDAAAFAEAWACVEAVLKLSGAGLSALAQVRLEDGRASWPGGEAALEVRRAGAHVFALALGGADG